MRTKIRSVRSEIQRRLDIFLRIVSSEGLKHNVITKEMISLCILVL